MTITVSALKRAVGEAARELGPLKGKALATLYHNPTSLTILAERLSQRPARRMATAEETQSCG